MDMLTICRICLIKDINMNSILHTNLEQLYEKLTAQPFQKDNRPLNICYICCARLRNCYRLQTSCLRSEELLSQMLDNNNQLKPKLLENTNSLKIVHPRIQLSCVPLTLMEPDDDEDDDEVIERPLSNAEKCKNYRKRKKDASQKIKKPPLTPAERSRMYRLRKQQLAQGIKSSVNEVLYTPSTSNSRMMFEPSPQPKDAQDNIIDHTENIKNTALEKIVKIERDDTEDNNATYHSIYCEVAEENIVDYTKNIKYTGLESIVKIECDDTEDNNATYHSIHCEVAEENTVDYTKNIKYTGLESIVKIERDDTEDYDATYHSINSEVAEENSTTNYIELNIEERAIKEEIIQPTELEDEQLLRDVDEVNRNSSQTSPRITCMKSIDDKFLKPVKIVLNRDDVDSVTDASAVKEEVKISTLGTITHSTTSSNSETEGSLEQNIPYERSNIENAEKNIVNNSSKIHTVDKPYMCKICEKCFGKKGHLMEHIRIHTGEKPYRCNMCDKSFKQSGSLVQHKRVHMKAYKEEECGSKTGGRVGILDKPFKCNICNRCYAHKTGLMRHTRTHTVEKIYICDVCDRSFTNREVLKNHVRIHSDEKLYKCNVCGKCFKIRSTLDSHKLIHTGVKPHKCKVCDKCFTLNGDLTKHLRRHTGEKPFKCDICGKCFICNSDLIGHRRIHTGERPFKCNICDKRFTVKSGLNSHSRTHNNKIILFV